MHRVDELYTAHPYYGVRRMVAVLEREGVGVNAKRVRRLMRMMGLEAIYPKPRLSQAGSAGQVFPYLLRNLAIERVHQVWAIDITYIRLREDLAIVEALMLGIPVLISDKCPWTDVAASNAGWALSLSEPAAFVKKLEALHAMGDEWSAMSEGAIRYSQATFNDNGTAERYRAAYG